MKRIIEKLETLLELSGLKKEIILLVISGISLLLSLFHIPLPFSIADRCNQCKRNKDIGFDVKRCD